MVISSRTLVTNNGCNVDVLVLYIYIVLELLGPVSDVCSAN